jgi:hypothetical protein
MEGILHNQQILTPKKALPITEQRLKSLIQISLEV